MKKVYLDNSSTTKVYKEAADLMMKLMIEDYGNPSSMHPMGLEAAEYMKQARGRVAKTLGAKRSEIIFTSGGTESDNIAIFGAAKMNRHKGKEIVSTRVEHPAVLQPLKRLQEQGFEIKYLDVDSNGQINMKQLEEYVTDETILISLMTVNNETGALTDIKEVSKRKKGALLHTDAVQAFGKMDLSAIGADLVSVSSHKIHGPMGIGALYAKEGINLPPFIYGGGQEYGIRCGTENLPAIAGFGVAAERSCTNCEGRLENIREARNRLLDNIRGSIDDVIINSTEAGSPAVLSVSFMGTRGEVLLHSLEQDGIYVSTGSACSEGASSKSHVLKAMGRTDKQIEGTLRFSFSEFNTPEEMDYVSEKLKAAVMMFRKLGSFR